MIVSRKYIDTVEALIKAQKAQIEAQTTVIESLKRTCALQVAVSRLGGRLSEDR